MQQHVSASAKYARLCSRFEFGGCHGRLVVECLDLGNISVQVEDDGAETHNIIRRRGGQHLRLEDTSPYPFLGVFWLLLFALYSLSDRFCPSASLRLYPSSTAERRTV